MKLTLRMAGCSISALTTAGAFSGAWVTTRTTSWPSPASTITSPSARWVRGQISDALSTTVLPQASGMANARVARITGAFHGAIPRHTPTGWRTAIAIEPGRSDG